MEGQCTRSGITYVTPNDQEHSLNFKKFSRTKLVAGVACKQSSMRIQSVTPFMNGF